MGTWLNVAFIQTEDTQQVAEELSRLLREGGRLPIAPKPRTPALYDPMQYGLGEEVPLWGVAGFQGAPGWTVLRTAPFELLMQGNPPLLARLATRLGVPAFQYNIYDSSSDFLLEVDARGRLERSGFVSVDVTRYWGGHPPEDRFDVRFRIIDVSAVASWAEEAMPADRVVGWVPPDSRSVKADQAERAELFQWLDEIGADFDAESHTWSTHPAHIIRRLAQHGRGWLSTDGVVDEAIMAVFGGQNSRHCDNLFLVQTIVPHAPMPVEGFVLYAESRADPNPAESG